MKVQSNNYSNNLSINCNTNEKSNSSFSSLKMPKDNFTKSGVHFGAANLSGMDSLKGGVSKFFDAILANFFLQFLVVDSVSMIIPRTVVGLNRDRDKTGNINFKAGAEEAYREVLSGPSMNLIPMAILWGMNKKYQSSQVEPNKLTSLTESMQTAVQGLTSKDKLNSAEDLENAHANQIFETAFPESEFALAERETLKKDFVKSLLEAKSVKPKLLLPQSADYKKKLGVFKELVSKINNQNKKTPPIDSQALSLVMKVKDDKGNLVDKKVSFQASELFDSFNHYTKDITFHFAKQKFDSATSETYKTDAVKVLENIRKNRANIKIATAAGAFFTVGAFLLYLPKLYQQSNVSPAMDSAKRAQAEVEGGANENK